MSAIIAWLSTGAGKYIAACALLVIEFWLGKTDVVKQGSILEIILSGIAKALAFIGVKADSPAAPAVAASTTTTPKV